MKYILTNKVTKNEYIYDNVVVNVTNIFYKVQFVIDSNMDEGEYEYQLLDDNDVVLSEGLLHYGEYNPKEGKTVYNNQKTYVQYGK